MNEKLKDAQTKVRDFWNKYDKKQKRLMVSIVAVVIVAVVILAVALSAPNYEVLIECEDTVSAAGVADILKSNTIDYTTENNGLIIKVPKNDVVTAMNTLLDESWHNQYGLEIQDVALNLLQRLVD